MQVSARRLLQEYGVDVRDPAASRRWEYAPVPVETWRAALAAAREETRRWREFALQWERDDLAAGRMRPGELADMVAAWSDPIALRGRLADLAMRERARRDDEAREAEWRRPPLSRYAHSCGQNKPGEVCTACADEREQRRLDAWFAGAADAETPLEVDGRASQITVVERCAEIDERTERIRRAQAARYAADTWLRQSAEALKGVARGALEIDCGEHDLAPSVREAHARREDEAEEQRRIREALAYRPARAPHGVVAGTPLEVD